MSAAITVDPATGRLRWTAQPGSRLARLRMQCHNTFDLRWKYGGTSRKAAYKWLAQEMGIAIERCHFGMFTEEQCERALAIMLRADFGD